MTNFQERHLLKQLSEELHNLRRKYFPAAPTNPALEEILMKMLSVTRAIDVRTKELEVKLRNMEFQFGAEKENN